MMPTNAGIVTDASLEFLKRTKPSIYKLLYDYYGDKWWESAVISKIDCVGRYDLANVKSSYIDFVDLYLLIRIVIKNRSFFHGCNLNGHILDNRFFELVRHLGDLRNKHVHCGDDISDDQLKETIDLMNEILYYIDGDEPEMLCNNIIKADNQIDVVNRPCVSEVHYFKKTIAPGDVHFVWKNDMHGSRFGCYSGDKRVANNVIISEDGLKPIQDLDDFSGVVRKSYGDGSYYEGHIMLGRRHGIGRMIDCDDESYNVGLYYKDSFVGEVNSIDDDSGIYDDSFHNVVIDCKKGGHYEGTIRYGAMNGNGVFISNEGYRREGVFFNNAYLGEVITFDDTSYDVSKLANYLGKISISNDSYTYSGYWKEGSMEGKGNISYHNGYEYRGDFHDGVPDGNGVAKLVNGDTYRGLFKRGAFHGNGKYLFSDSSSFEGIFAYNVINGPGTFRHHSGVIISGVWNHGVLSGECTFSINKTIVKGYVCNGSCIVESDSIDKSICDSLCDLNIKSSYKTNVLPQQAYDECNICNLIPQINVNPSGRNVNWNELYT